MKKASLITCHNIKNYGSVFQTYATTKIFEKKGYIVEVIDYQRPGTDKVGFRKKITSESHLAKKMILRHCFPLVLTISFRKMESVFEIFINKYILLTCESFFTEQELKEKCPDSDVYISGSDQIWNSDINGRIELPYFLTFVPEEKKKISFASSFGKDSLSEWEKQETRRLLERYDVITTREAAGVNIVNSLGLEAIEILDPTLWLRKEEWEQLEEPILAPKRFILIYQLHKNEKMDRYVEKIQREYKIPCLRIDLYYHYVVKAGRHIICPRPGQVITLIKNAEYIVTDSFHMTVFSILFQKQFVTIISKNSFGDRIYNILKWLELESRILNDYEDYKTLALKINYENCNNLLETKKQELELWLDEMLKKM